MINVIKTRGGSGGRFSLLLLATQQRVRDIDLRVTPRYTLWLKQALLYLQNLSKYELE